MGPDFVNADVANVPSMPDPAPTSGKSATCESCAHCPWMAMNGLAAVAEVLEHGSKEVPVDPALG